MIIDENVRYLYMKYTEVIFVCVSDVYLFFHHVHGKYLFKYSKNKTHCNKDNVLNNVERNHKNNYLVYK